MAVFRVDATSQNTVIFFLKSANPNNFFSNDYSFSVIIFHLYFKRKYINTLLIKVLKMVVIRGLSSVSRFLHNSIFEINIKQ